MACYEDELNTFSYYAFSNSSIARSKKKPEIDPPGSQFWQIRPALVSWYSWLLARDNKCPQSVLQSFIEQFYECRRKQWVGLHAYWGESKQHKCHVCIVIHCYSVALLHCYIVALLHCYSVALLHCYIVALLYIHFAWDSSSWVEPVGFVILVQPVSSQKWF